MNIYRAEMAPQPPPLIWDSEAIYSVPPSEGTWNDVELRRGIERAMQFDREAVAAISKHLVAAEVQALHALSLRFPFFEQPMCYTPGCMSDEQEMENQALKNFAFDAYDALAEHFGEQAWRGWFVAPFFVEGDDTEQFCSIGVFEDEDFMNEVVE